MEKISFYLFIISTIILISCKDIKSLEIKENSLIVSNSTLKKTTKTYLEAWSDNDSVVLEMITIHNLIRNVNGDIQSVNQHELYESMNELHTVMPDYKIIDKEVNVIDNRIYVTWVGTGTNTGMVGDVPPTGKIGHLEGISILTFNDENRIVHEAVFFDNLALLKEWGYSISPPIMK